MLATPPEKSVTCEAIVKPIQFVDLRTQYHSIKEDIDRVIADVIDGSLFIRGPYVETFEKRFAQMFDIRHCVSCGNGTDSLLIAMKALGVTAGDEVICPAHSWISTSETISQAGGKVIFCDTDPDTFNINADQLESLITERTVGIIPVHLYGQPADMDPIMDLAQKYEIWVLEDCAQAHLCTYRGRNVGTIGNVGSFSFYPSKNLGAMGDAGGLITADGVLAERMAMIARHGGLSKGQHLIEGINSRMDGLQAAILGVKCVHLERWTQLRQHVAAYYLEHISNPRLTLPKVSEFGTHVWHLFVVKCNDRDDLRAYLSERGIPTVISYPIALPFLQAYERLGARPEDFPNSYHNQSRILSIPIYPELEQDQMDYIVDSLNSF